MAINLDSIAEKQSSPVIDLTRQETERFVRNFFQERSITLADIGQLLQFKNKAKHIDVSAFVTEFSLDDMVSGQGKGRKTGSGGTRKPRGKNFDANETQVAEFATAALKVIKEAKDGEKGLKAEDIYNWLSSGDKTRVDTHGIDRWLKAAHEAKLIAKEGRTGKGGGTFWHPMKKGEKAASK